jgi:hypothetical protein
MIGFSFHRNKDGITIACHEGIKYFSKTTPVLPDCCET